MKRFRDATVIRQLYSIFHVAILIILSTVIIFYSITFHSLQNEKHTQMEHAAIYIVQSTENSLSSVVLMGETVSSTLYTRLFLTETYAPKQISHRQQLNRLINKLIKSASQIENILVMNQEGTVYSFSNFDYLLASKLDLKYQIFEKGRDSNGFTGALYLPEEGETYYAYYHPIYDNDEVTRIGTCIIIGSTLPLRELCARAVFSSDALFAILDSQEQLVVSNLEREASLQWLQNTDQSGYLSLRYPSSSADWTVVCSIPYEQLFSDLDSVRLLACLLVAILLLTFLLLVFLISKSIASPIVKIANYLHNEPDYILRNKIDVSGSAEITTLTANINQMLADINSLTEANAQKQQRMYEIELSENHAKLMALQNQINPHFIYNTLTSIQGLAYLNKGKEINTMVTALSYLMHYSLNGSNMATVREEFYCSQQYLKIIELRYPNRFRFELDMEEAAGDLEVPRFILQPVVENAVSHGLLPSEAGNTLRLSASLLDDSTLMVVCTDNGVGILPDALEQLREELKAPRVLRGARSGKQSNIGLMNIQMRIQLLYGAGFGLSLDSGENGTRVSLELPPSRQDFLKRKEETGE